MAIDLNKLLEDIQNPDEDMVVLALRTLKRVSGPSFSNNVAISTKIIAELERLVEESSDEVVFFAQECLDYVKENVPSVGKAAAAEPEPPPAAAAPATPAAVPGLDSGDKIVAFLAKGVGDPNKASAALLALRKFVRAEHLPLVKKYMRHKAPKVRVEAATTIAAAGDERVILETLLPYLNDKANEVREAVLKAIRGIDHQRLMTVIETMLRSSQISIKVAAVYILAHLQGDEVVRLLGVAARDKQEEVRSRVVDALQGRRGKEVLVILKGLVNDMDIDVAEKALKIYEKLKFEEGILNSSAELGDIIMEKLREISLEDDEDPDEDDGEEDLPLEVPTTAKDRIPVGEQNLNEFVVPKKTKKPKRQAQTPAPEPTVEVVSDTAAPSAEEKDEFKKLSEYPEEIQKMSEEVYDQLDELLEEMGRTIWRLEKANRIADRRFSKLNYDIQRYEDMLAKRTAEQSSKEGFFSKLSAGNKRLQEKQQMNLEFSLSELYRRLGEVAIELSLSNENRFPELDSYYRKVNHLLEEVRKIKEMHHL